jgi:multidrug resistance efflux pump
LREEPGRQGAGSSVRRDHRRHRDLVRQQIGGVNTTVARLQAELREAEYDLEETTVTAPTDGYVTQPFLRPGMIAVPCPCVP